MTMTATMDDLAAATSNLDGDRLDVLIGQLDEAANMEENTEGNPDQLGLFGFKELVESDDELKIVRLPEITAVYGITDRTLKRHIADNTLTARKVGRAYGVTIANLKRYLNQSTK